MMLVNITRVFVIEKRTSKLPQIQPERPVCHPHRSRRISCRPAKNISRERIRNFRTILLTVFLERKL